MRLRAEDSVLVVVDIQPNFMTTVVEAERVVKQSRFLLEVARILDVPVLATEQNPARMGGTDARLLDLIPGSPLPKMAFSAYGAPGFADALTDSGRSQVVIVGVETHICVTQTALDVMNEVGLDAFVVADAVSGRGAEAHAIGLQRLADSGAFLPHSESVVYEWMGTAEHPRFRDVLAVVKAQAE